MHYSKFLRYFFLTCIFGLLGSMSFVWWVDPLQYYRRNPGYPLDCNDRWQVAGFIRTFDFETIILGTSMTQNFSLQETSTLFGGEAIRLSLAGATVLEQLTALKAALRNRPIKRVIWGLDRHYLNYTCNKYSPSFPVNLYGSDFFGQFTYLLNTNFVERSVSTLKKKLKKQLHDRNDLEGYNAWHDLHVFGKEVLLKQCVLSLNNSINEPNALPSDFFENKEVEGDLSKQYLVNFERDVLPLLQAYPNVHFHIFYPPYSVLYYKTTYGNNLASLKNEMNMRYHICRKLISLKNVTVYDFETVEDIILNLDEYKDLTHYSKHVNHYMLQSMAYNKHAIGEKDLEKFRTKFAALPFLKWR